jgi:GNAT superfamily N-acetyltransferase
VTALPAGFAIGRMRRDEVPVLEGWAADEGWNPGLADLGIAWETDPAAFIALRRGEELAGAGTILSYGDRFGFMGLFIVRRDLRGRGLGAALWHHRLDRLRKRLRPGAPIGMDGVFELVPFYAKGGFVLAYRDLRFDGVAAGEADRDAVSLAEAGFDAIDDYDRRHVPAPRSAFLGRWLEQPGAHVVALREQGAVVGYGVARPCHSGYRIAPVFADRPDLAERVVAHLMSCVAGEPVQLDVPEPNRPGLELAARFSLVESFGCARMYFGPDPRLPVERIFGVTSFEFG